MNKTRYRISFYPCTHCGFKANEEIINRENGTWCWEYQLNKDWLCGGCQIGKCRPEKIIDRIKIVDLLKE